MIRRLLWVILGLAVLLALLWEFVQIPDAGERLGRIPLTGYGFGARDLPLSDLERNIFGKARVLKRVYRVGRQGVVLQVIDATRDRHAIHDPLFCFRGAGWEIVAESRVAVPGGFARQLTLRRNADLVESVVWFSDGTSRHGSTPRQWWQTILRRVTCGVSGPEPVLVILQPINGGSVAWPELFAQLPLLFSF